MQSQAQIMAPKSRVLELQASAVLNEMYCNILRKQLAYQEEKKNKPKGKGRLVGDGLPRLLTGDEFYERVCEFTKAQEREEREKAARKVARVDRQGVMAAWRERETIRKAENRAKSERHQAAVKAWESRKAAAKAAKKKFLEIKPKREALAAPEPKPSNVAAGEESKEDEGEDEIDDDNNKY